MSDDKRKFSTGSVRDSVDGKGTYCSIPPEALRRTAKRFEFGAKKYGNFNFQKGQPMSVLLDSAFRHLTSVLAGETNEDHAAAVVWNMMVFMQQQERLAKGELPDELDDMPGGRGFD